ncbi:hypothetical protein BS47DRAFT_1403025 [Hydnum rufescens UP504]|uniref:Uncharacterized protein n=1 Tax=Hydnum rufescens UP504 TaxID=1448309 RepID=A0A9P6DLU0_9AGAM|nr:hypothetical protein BS47DRAFT_1403025 [Hydnum rufescens UP504]
MSQITPGKRIPPLQFALRFALRLITLSFLGELAWARRFPDIFKRVLWDFWRGPCVHTTSGLKPLIAEYRWPLSPFVLPVNELGPDSYDFQASDPTIFPQPLQPTLRHRAFMPTSYDGPVPGDSPNRLGSMLAEWLEPYWAEAQRWMNLLKPYHPIPSHLNPESLQTLLSQLDSQDAGVWIKVRLLGLELQGLSRMFMGRAVVLLSLYNRVLPPVWPTDVALMGTFVEHSRRSEFADALEELEPSGAPVWAVEFLESYFSHDRVKFSEKDSKSRDNPRRSAVLRHVAQERQGYDTVYDAISRLYIPTHAELCASGINPYWGMRHVRHEVGSPRWLYALRQMVFDTVEPGFSGQMEWNEVHVRLANLLRLPKAWGGRHSVLSLMRVGDDRVLTPPSWCTTVPRSLQKACVSHLAEADAFLYFADVFQCTPPPRPVSPSAPPGYRPPPVSLTQIQVPQPQPPLPSSPTPTICDLSHDASLSRPLGSRESPIRIDPPSTVIEVDLDAVTIPHDASPSRLLGSREAPIRIDLPSTVIDVDLDSATIPHNISPSPLLGSTESPIIVDPPSTVIEVDLDKATTALASAAPHDTPGSAAHPSSSASAAATEIIPHSVTPDSDLHLISATFPQDPIPTSTWYFVGVGPIGTKESPVAECLAAYRPFGALGVRLAVEVGSKARSIRLLFKVQAQAQAVVRGYEEGTLQGGFPGIRSAWITRSESIDKYYAHVDLEYYSLVLARGRARSEMAFLLHRAPLPYNSPGVDSSSLSKREKNLAKKQRLFDHFVELSRYPALLRDDPSTAQMDVHWEPNRSLRPCWRIP